MISLFLLSFLTSFFCFFGTQRPDIKMINKHINAFATEEKQKGFYLIASGGQMMDNIKVVHLSFDLQKKVGVDEARLMLIEMTQKFMRQVNADEKIRPYLENYPINHLNAEFTLNFKDKRHIYLEEGVACAMMVKNKIYYFKSDSETGPLKDLYEETYAEALEKVNAKKSQLTQITAK
jgi:hypothetical protein